MTTKEKTVLRKYRIACLLLLSFCFYGFSYASEVGNMDIITIRYKGKSYYISFYSENILKNNDLCYYDRYNGEYMGEVKDAVLQQLNSKDSISLFSELEMINIEKLGISIYEGSIYDDQLYILNNALKVASKKVKPQFEVEAAFSGNTSGFTYTPALKSIDNTWLDSYPIECLFSLKGFAICDYNFYGIKGNTTKNEKAKLKKRIQSIINKDDYEAFESMLRDLYKRNIIMVGFCSC